MRRLVYGFLFLLSLFGIPLVSNATSLPHLSSSTSKVYSSFIFSTGHESLTLHLKQSLATTKSNLPVTKKRLVFYTAYELKQRNRIRQAFKNQIAAAAQIRQLANQANVAAKNQQVKQLALAQQAQTEKNAQLQAQQAKLQAEQQEKEQQEKEQQAAQQAAVNTPPPQVSTQSSNETTTVPQEQAPPVNQTQATQATPPQVTSSTSTQANPAPPETSTKPIQAVLQPNTLKIGDQVIPLVDDQGAAAAPSGDLAGIWKGTGIVDDNQPTHIIGHNPGIFASLLSLKVGNQVTVMDRLGHTKDYTIYQILKVNDDAIGEDGKQHWNDILNQPGESISLQTCIDDYWNLMFLAR